MAYLSNVSFSLYYNIKIAGETFEKQRLINSLYKILAFAGGTMLLVLSTSLIIPWANKNNLPIPAEYSTVISTVATLGVCLSGSLRLHAPHTCHHYDDQHFHHPLPATIIILFFKTKKSDSLHTALYEKNRIHNHIIYFFTEKR